MKDFGKKIINIIIGMLIATFLIVFFLFYINRSFFERPPLAEAPDEPVINSKTPIVTEILNPVDLNGDSQTKDLTTSKIDLNNKTNELELNDYNSNTDNHTNSNDSYNNNAIDNVHLNVPPSDETNKKQKNISPKNEPDTIGELIKNINKDTNNRPKITVNATKNYKLQIGSFKTIEEANKQKARLIMMGIGTNIEKAHVNGQQYYRVITTQLISKEEAGYIKSNLKRKGIDSLIISQ